jgi:hypothetical protein
MICLHTKFHVRSYIGSLDIAIKSKQKNLSSRGCHVVVSNSTKSYLNKNVIFFNYLLPHILSGYGSASGVSVVLTSQVCMSIWLLLLAAGR